MNKPDMTVPIGALIVIRNTLGEITVDDVENGVYAQLQEAILAAQLAIDAWSTQQDDETSDLAARVEAVEASIRHGDYSTLLAVVEALAPTDLRLIVQGIVCGNSVAKNRVRAAIEIVAGAEGGER